MSITTPVNNARVNSCPHGMPAGACPICNGGGGASRQKSVNEPRNPGELTYAQCAAIGALMKAQRAAQTANMEQQRLMALVQLQNNLNNLINKLQNVLTVIQNSLPAPLNNAFGKIVNNLITPLLNLIKDLPQIMKNINEFINTIKLQIHAVMEKLTAILGEMKNFIKDKTKEAFKKIKKKILSIFSFFMAEEGEIDSEAMEIIESKELSKIKKLLKSIKKQSGENDNERN